MHIKQVLISGFRSFRNQNEIEHFSSKHNVIVGRNGSGKSNFFDAIQFVLLAPRFASLRQEDRQYLLHEGAGSSVMAAYVEIIFDNSDGRLSVDSEEVILRRTIGHKKDEFFINRKRTQKSEVLSLLESAGFSKSNPYYIVQQGKVSNLCVMKDKDRLQLLKEVAGTTVYEERRSESLKIMEETSSKLGQISEVLTFIEQRLNELEKEKEELIEYEQLDKNRRAIDCHINSNELQKANHALAEVDTSREVHRQRHQDLYAGYQQLQEKLQSDEELLQGEKDSLDRIKTRKEIKLQEMSQQVARRSSLGVQLQEAEAAALAQGEELTQLTQQLQQVVQQIAVTEAELASSSPEYLSQQSLLRQTGEQLAGVRRRIETLYGKQGRGMQFATVKDRNAFLRSQIGVMEVAVRDKTALSQRLTLEADQEEEENKTELQRLALAEQENQRKTDSLTQLQQNVTQLTAQRNAKLSDKKDVQSEVDLCQEKIAEAKRDLERGKQALSSTLPKHISQGLACVERIAAEKKIRGYHGPIIDNFRLKSDVFKTAVEVAAGNALFHVIVDDDVIAAQLMKELERRKAGRLTFLPLNRLRVEQVEYPDSGDAKPLSEAALEYDAKFEDAMAQVFNKKLLTRDLEVAAQFSREYRLDCITAEGDQVGRKGGFEGGFHDERSSRITAVLRIREANSKLTELSQLVAQRQSDLDAMEAAIQGISKEAGRLEDERDHIRSNAAQSQRELENRRKRVASSTKLIENKRESCLEILKEIQTTKQQIIEYTSESKTTSLTSKLTPEERNELQSLIAEERLVSVSEAEIEESLCSLRSRRELLSQKLQKNLYKRKQEIDFEIDKIRKYSDSVAATPSTSSSSSSSSSSGRGSEKKQKAARSSIALQTIQSNLNDCMQQIKILESEIEEIEKSYDAKNSDFIKLEKLFELTKNQESKIKNDLSEESKAQDKLLNKRTMLQTTIQQRQRAIQELGTLPRKEVEEFKNHSEKQLHAKMKEVSDKLKKYAAVNRKALDQYVSFNSQRETLLHRRSELQRDSGAIQQLVDSLDQQKEEAILRTFRSVSKNFTEVFSELVTGGRGQLVMRTLADQHTSGAAGEGEGEGVREVDADLGDEEEEGSGGGRLSTGLGVEERKGASPERQGHGHGKIAVSSLLGVQVRVSFSGTGQQLEMQQLSGGQKALVALAIIFSIQRCDPAPFYLFDEIDQALDANYRAGVARLIQKQANSPDCPAQFITTTFRPELVSVANKWFGITLQNKVSNIYPIDKAHAQKFVVDLMTEEEAVGQVTAIPSFSRHQRHRNKLEEEEEEEEEDQMIVESNMGEAEEGEEAEENEQVFHKQGRRGSRGRGSGKYQQQQQTEGQEEEEKEQQESENENEEDMMVESYEEVEEEEEEVERLGKRRKSSSSSKEKGNGGRASIRGRGRSSAGGGGGRRK